MTLLDANVLLALAWPNHPFHTRARGWFAGNGANGWGTCLLTEAAFVRLSANPAVVPTPRRAADCIALLEAMKKHGLYRFVDDACLSRRQLLACVGKCRGHRQVNDAFLIAMAASHDIRLVTFDQRLAALAENPATVEVLA